jgi:hypothetical protein
MPKSQVTLAAVEDSPRGIVAGKRVVCKIASRYN